MTACTNNGERVTTPLQSILGRFWHKVQYITDYHQYKNAFITVTNCVNTSDGNFVQILRKHLFYCLQRVGTEKYPTKTYQMERDQIPNTLRQGFISDPNGLKLLKRPIINL